MARPTRQTMGLPCDEGRGNREPTSMTDFCFLHRKRVAKRGTCCSSFIQMNVHSWKKFWGASDCGVRTSGQKMTFIFFPEKWKNTGEWDFHDACATGENCWWFSNPCISWYGKYPIIYQGFMHPRWLARFLPSTVFSAFWNFSFLSLSMSEVRSGGVVKAGGKTQRFGPWRFSCPKIGMASLRDPELKGWKSRDLPNSCWLKRSRFLNSTGPGFFIFIFRCGILVKFFLLHFLLAIFPVLEK